MRLEHKDRSSVRIRFTKAELAALLTGVGQAQAWLSKRADDFFAIRLELSRRAAEELYQRLSLLLRGVEQGDDGASTTLLSGEVVFLIRCLNEVANGTYIPEWEFHTLTGHTRAELRALVHDLVESMVSSGKRLREQ